MGAFPNTCGKHLKTIAFTANSIRKYDSDNLTELVKTLDTYRIPTVKLSFTHSDHCTLSSAWDCFEFDGCWLTSMIPHRVDSKFPAVIQASSSIDLQTYAIVTVVSSLAAHALDHVKVFCVIEHMDIWGQNYFHGTLNCNCKCTFYLWPFQQKNLHSSHKHVYWRNEI